MTFETRTKKKDGELLAWLLVGGFFTIALIVVDFTYSSVNEMSKVGRAGIWVGHGLLSALWVGVLAYFKDPNYDYFRKAATIVAVILAFVIAIHHATSKEDAQVIIDSKDNVWNGGPIDVYIDGERVGYTLTESDSIVYTFNDSTVLLKML